MIAATLESKKTSRRAIPEWALEKAKEELTLFNAISGSHYSLQVFSEAHSCTVKEGKQEISPCFTHHSSLLSWLAGLRTAWSLSNKLQAQREAEALRRKQQTEKIVSIRHTGVLYQVLVKDHRGESILEHPALPTFSLEAAVKSAIESVGSTFTLHVE